MIILSVCQSLLSLGRNLITEEKKIIFPIDIFNKRLIIFVWRYSSPMSIFYMIILSVCLSWLSLERYLTSEEKYINSSVVILVRRLNFCLKIGLSIRSLKTVIYIWFRCLQIYHIMIINEYLLYNFKSFPLIDVLLLVNLYFNN